MRIGVVYPQTELAADTGAVRAYASAVEALGYSHVLAYDHVLGADPTVHEGWRGPYDIDTTFREPMVLFGFLAAITDLELVTGIIILPQRQTALVAKQAAELALLTGGNFRLGVGIGWNAVEYESLGEDFTTRGRRMGEQVELLRRLWAERSVTFEGRFDTVRGAGLAPRPPATVPIWFGGSSEPAYERAGRLADGWFPQVQPGDRLDEAKATVDRAARAAGRDPAAIGMEGRVTVGDRLVEFADRWRTAGASHISVNTMGVGLQGVDAHIAALGEAAGALGLAAR
ncbi:MAG TPA: LLM class F420-dependent oxidoreductase [Acidimicrobiales bacterium]|nr:LLM class F420-dependent oxidoreductase [Acidimicrobiales bacterium]